MHRKFDRVLLIEELGYEVFVQLARLPVGQTGRIGTIFGGLLCTHMWVGYVDVR